MSNTPNTKVRMFGSLHTVRRNRGLESYEQMYIPPEGRSGFDLAKELDLPLNKIEGIFINNTAYSLDKVVHPGDKVAFISSGVPGPHRYSLGIHAAGKHLREEQAD